MPLYHVKTDGLSPEVRANPAATDKSNNRAQSQRGFRAPLRTIHRFLHGIMACVLRIPRFLSVRIALECFRRQTPLYYGAILGDFQANSPILRSDSGARGIRGIRGVRGIRGTLPVQCRKAFPNARLKPHLSPRMSPG